MNILRAARTGIIDGWEQPYELRVGMSYESDRRQAAYDRGTIWGQRAARIVATWPASEGATA